MSGEKPAVRLGGRILYLTEDAGLVRRQLSGEDLAWDANDASHALRDQISTDEITPGWVCFHHDEALGRFAYLGVTCAEGDARVTPFGEGAVRAGGFAVSVAGRRRGKGSSREQAPYAERAAGIRLLVAESFERIYRQNAINLGMLVTTDFSILARVRRGEEIPLSFFTDGEDAVTRGIVEAGGLLAYTRARLAGGAVPPPFGRAARPMTLAEKILARHAGVPAVAPGDAGFVRTDWRFSHEYVTPMAANAFEAELGSAARVTDPESVLLFRDHLALLGEVMPEERRRRGLLALADGLAARQEEFARAQGLKLHGAGDGICHSLMLERYARPGQVVVGSDSHTTHAGALGALAFGIGTSEVAAAWLSRDVRVAVPATIRVELTGALPAGVAAKDVMLTLLAHPAVRSGGAIGKALEYGGDAVRAMSVDERATLTNMAAEAGAFAGIVAPDDATARFLAERRGLPLDDARRACEGLAPDPGAAYDSILTLDVSALAPLVALPGDPGNGVRIADLARDVPIDIAYGGSCTAGKREDMEMLAAVLADGLARGRRVASGVRFYVQFGSRDVREWCREKGYLDLFARAGAVTIEPGCGACIAAGPGVSTRPDEVTVSAINRNFPGRSGPGSVYLASPYVVAASALAGRITAWTPGA
ncbi:MAG: 3-isopropylmalate dehydratase [Acidobacteria bacterium]|nr:3-isopropylmalate dehydratase [Acidobacteriota bacterium]